MIVTIEDTIFAAQIDPLLLLAIIRYGFEGRHIILTDPFFKSSGNHHVNAWLGARDPLVRDAVIEAFNRGLRALPSTASVVSVRVADRQQSHWKAQPPLLTAEDAAALLAQPLHLVLEDRFADKHFLLCVLPEPKRTELRRALERHWCRAEHGGGLSNMRLYVESLRHVHDEMLRTWVLFDSDAQAPGQPSKDSSALQARCRELPLPHHQLQRRSIENYLPPKALWEWAARLRGMSNSQRRKIVQEFEAMPATQRHHLAMKEKFDDRIAELFKESQIDPAWLREDGQESELEAIMRGIFERM